MRPEVRITGASCCIRGDPTYRKYAADHYADLHTKCQVTGGAILVGSVEAVGTTRTTVDGTDTGGDTRPGTGAPAIALLVVAPAGIATGVLLVRRRRAGPSSTEG